MAETISTNQFKNGMCIELDGVVWQIVEFQHVKPGKGGAFVRTKLKQMEGGKVVEQDVPRRRVDAARAHDRRRTCSSCSTTAPTSCS